MIHLFYIYSPFLFQQYNKYAYEILKISTLFIIHTHDDYYRLIQNNNLEGVLSQEQFEFLKYGRGSFLNLSEMLTLTTSTSLACNDSGVRSAL